MKKQIIILVVSLVFLSVFDVKAQLHRNDKFALERVSIHRWNKFRPWWLFEFVFPKYKKGDKRMVPKQAMLLAATSVTEIQSRKEKEYFDSIGRQAEIKALDRIANLNWNLFYKAEVQEMEAKIEEIIIELAQGGATPHEILMYQTLFNLTREGLYIVLDSFLEDVEKREAIIRYKSFIENFLQEITTLRDVIGYTINEDELRALEEEVNQLREILTTD